MCTNGINTGQFSQMIDQIDDHIKLERRWAHMLAHQAGDAGFAQTNEKLHNVQALLDDVRAMLDEAKENYLTEVDTDAAEIQEAYQQTMNSGFKGMSLFVAACSIVGLVLLVPYKDKKRLAQSEK